MSSLEKSFLVLEQVVARQDTGLSFSEIVFSNNFPKSSVHRILKILLTTGYLVYEEESKKYRGGLKLARLGAKVIENFDLRNIIRPHLQKLHEDTGHTCHVGIENDGRGVYLDKIESRDYGIRLFSEIGKDFPLHCTGLGKVLLAYLPQSRQIQIINEKNLVAFTDKTLTEPDKLIEELIKIKKNGYALDMEEITRGIMCVAAPIINFNQQIIAGISVTFPSFVAKENGLKKEIQAVTKYSKDISALLGAD